MVFLIMLVGILTFLSFIYYFAGSSLLSLSLHNNAWDLGIFNQVLYNTATGHPFFYSFRSFGNYLGDHFSPILVFFAPLSLFKSSLPLLFIQALFLALSVFVLYHLSHAILKSRIISFAIAFSFAVNPFTLNILNFDWHPDFAFPLFFFAALYFLLKSRKESPLQGDSFLESSRYLAYTLLCVILLQLVREDAFLLIVPLAAIFFWKFRQKRLALLTLIFTLSYTVIVLFFVMPGIRGGASSPLAEHYPYLGRSLGEIGLNIARNPFIIVQKFLGVSERTTLLKFFGSIGFLPLLSPFVLLLSAPIFAANFLSVIPMRINLEGHYPAQLLAFMYVAIIFGLERINSIFASRYSEPDSGSEPFVIQTESEPSPLRHPELGSGSGFRIKSGMTEGEGRRLQDQNTNYQSVLSLKHLVFEFVSDFGIRISNFVRRVIGVEKLLSGYLILVAVVSFALFSPFPPSLFVNIDRFIVTGHHQLFFNLIKTIPDNVPVSAQTNLVPALAFRKDVFEFPDLREADYVFLDEKGPVSGQSITWGYYRKKDNLQNCGYSLIKDEDGFKIYKKDPGFNLLRLLGC